METAHWTMEAARWGYFALIGGVPLLLAWWGLGPRPSGAVASSPRLFWPLLFTFPALLLALGRETHFALALEGLSGAAWPVAVTGPEQLLLALYAGAAALLYYRPPTGRRAWVWAAAVCAAPMGLAMQAAWSGGLWADESGGGGTLLPDLLAYGLCLAAWVGLLLIHHPALRRAQALA